MFSDYTTSLWQVHLFTDLFHSKVQREPITNTLVQPIRTLRIGSSEVGGDLALVSDYNRKWTGRRTTSIWSISPNRFVAKYYTDSIFAWGGIFFIQCRNSAPVSVKHFFEFLGDFAIAGWKGLDSVTFRMLRYSTVVILLLGVDRRHGRGLAVSSIVYNRMRSFVVYLIHL